MTWTDYTPKQRGRVAADIGVALVTLIKAGDTVFYTGCNPEGWTNRPKAELLKVLAYAKAKGFSIKDADSPNKLWKENVIAKRFCLKVTRV